MLATLKSIIRKAAALRLAVLEELMHVSGLQAALRRVGLERIEQDVAVQSAQLNEMQLQLNEMQLQLHRIEQATSVLEGPLLHRLHNWAGLVRYLRKSEYLQHVEAGRLAVPILETRHPIALDTDDTRHPRGARVDNSICLRFNQRLYDLLGRNRQLKVLDLGCAGGGFVRSLIDDGHFAVGLDGSDYPKRTQRDEWSTIPYHLHTCDVTKPFSLKDTSTGEPLQFDAITAWELLEHIRVEDLTGLVDNIRAHLADDGYFFASVATFEDYDEDHGWVYHQTIQPREWWIAQFRQAGFDVVEQTGIGRDDWVRGSGHCWGDWHEDQGLGFHIVLQKRCAMQRSTPEGRRRSAASSDRRPPGGAKDEEQDGRSFAA